MKKLSSLTFISFLIGLGLWYFNINHKKSVIETTEWKTYTKKKDQTVQIRKSTPKELKKIREEKVVFKKKKVRAPSSTTRKELSYKYQYRGRALIGHQASTYHQGQKKLKMLNQVNEDWERLAGESLLRHRKSGSKVFIKPQESFISINNNKGRYTEKVVVTSINTFGKESSFNALVDSQTGKVLRTWNKTIHEDFTGKTRPSLNARPFIN